uniref:Uncharacterized protein n=1 Tax=viral metagenome TaxID=1070528 RepID=A0A6C0I0P8_9ZZZZ
MLKAFLFNFIILIVITILLLVKFKNMKEESQMRLKEDGWTLHILDNCDHCKTQLEDIPLFKTYIKYTNSGVVIENKEVVEKIPIEDIYAFPLWYNTKTKDKIYGVQDIKAILEMYQKKDEQCIN